MTVPRAPASAAPAGPTPIPLLYHAAARIVAAGSFGQPRDSLRATIVLDPVRANGGGGVALKDWPQKVHEWLAEARLQLMVSPMRLAAGAACALPGNPLTVAARPLGARGLTAADYRDLVAIWADAMMVEGDNWSPVEKTIAAGGAVPGATPVVAGYGRADAALALTLDRGRRVLDRLCGRVPAARQVPRAPAAARSDRLLQFAAASNGGGWGGLAALSDAEAALDEPPAADPNIAAFLVDAARHTTAVAQARLAYLESRGTDPLAATQLAACQAALSRGTAPVVLAQAVAVGDPAPVADALLRSVTAQAAPHDDEAMRANIRRAETHYEDEAPLLALRSYPTLERLFGFAFDVRIDLAELLRRFEVTQLAVGEAECLFSTGDEEWHKAGQCLAYAFLSLDPGAGAGAAAAGQTLRLAPTQVWTTARLRLGRPPGRPPGRLADASSAFAEALAFTPCTREELDRRAAGAANPRHPTLVQQIEGVVDLAQTTPCTGGNPPRYEITSLDTVSAIQGEAATVAWNGIRQKRMEDPNPMGTKLALLDAGDIRLVTAGLALIDRQRCEAEVVAAVQAAHAAGCTTPVMHDADDLTVGYRVDVAPARPGSGLAWRSLMRRRLHFTAAAAPGRDRVMAMLGKLLDGPGLGADWRATLEEAVCRFLLRVPDKEAVPGTAPSRLHAEEMLGPWSGDPLGLAAVQADSLAHGLDIGITMSLPQDRTEARPPRLRFGWRYRIGLRAAYLGGVSAPIADAAATYAAHKAGLTLPSPGDALDPAGWMFRRQEGIGRPMLALPQVEIARTLPAARNGVTRVVLTSPAPVPMAGHMVVRLVTGTGSISQRQRDLVTQRTRRIVLPPMMPQHFCTLHDAFANAEPQPFAFDVPEARPGAPAAARRITGLRPRDGLRGVDFAAAWGGFPVLGSVEPLPGQSARGDEDDEVDIYTADPAHPAAPGWDPARGTPRGDAVFRLGQGTGGDRPQPYYPDPAASMMVFSLARPGTAGQDPFALLEVPIYTDARPPANLRQRGYPDVVPIVLELLQGAPAAEGPTLGWRGGEADRAAIWLYDPSQPDPSRMPRPGQPRPAGIAVRWVVVRLRPGEDFELNIWCAPTPLMAAVFNATEAAAALLTQRGFACAAPGSTVGAGADAAARAGFAAMAGCSLPAPRGTALDAPNFALGGLPLPSEQTIDCLGAQVTTALQRRPMPEIASNIAVRVTSALDKPLTAPAFRSDGEIASLRVLRVRSAHLRDSLLPGPGAISPGLSQRLADPASWTFEAALQAPDGTPVNELLFAGRVGFARRECESLELRVTGPFLSGGKFDDPQRGRTRMQRASGLWPETFDGTTIGGRSVFGFDVWPDGRHALPAESTTLLRFDNVPAQGPDWIDLLAEQRGVAAKKDRLADDMERVVRLPAFPDGKARRITVTPIVVARHGGLMTTRYGERFEDRARTGAPVTLWVAAMQRPDPPAALTPMPSFSFTDPAIATGRIADAAANRPAGSGSATLRTTTFGTRRQSMVRILCDRPWFSSGEGERLGIVLWPPEVFTPGATALLQADRVPLRGRDLPADIAEFPDDALGPGGSFVTRWGADPVRGGAAPQGWLMTAQQFPDAAPPPGNAEDADTILAAGGEPGSVIIDRNLPMPLPTRHGAGNPTTPPVLVVTVLSYRPRFDPQMERWYADVAIDVGDVVTPFVRLGLVRHQPCAPRALRLSEPVVAWTQVLPERHLQATLIEAHSPGRFAALLEVELSGRASDAPAVRASTAPGPVAAAEALAEQRAVVNLRLVRSEPSPGGAPTEVTIWEQLGVPPSFAAAGLVWKVAGIELPEDPLAEEITSRNVRYTVHVEEVERYPAAGGGENSPDAPAGTGRLASTGPRFVGVLQLARAGSTG